MRAALILAFARVIRWPMVDSCTRKAREISGTVRPPTMRRVSATRASGARAGWQHVKIRRSRSSSIAPRGSGGSSSYTICACFCLSSRLFSRRIRSMALRLAVVVSHAPGLGGTPSAGHRSTAIANASAADSSAMSRSPKRRVREATTRAHSSRCVRVMASWTSVWLTGTDAPRPSGGPLRRSRKPGTSRITSSADGRLTRAAAHSFNERSHPDPTARTGHPASRQVRRAARRPGETSSSDPR